MGWKLNITTNRCPWRLSPPQISPGAEVLMAALPVPRLIRPSLKMQAASLKYALKSMQITDLEDSDIPFASKPFTF